MMVNPVVPARIRRLINVESGLNDGIATPVVSVALAGAATGGQVAEHGPAALAADLAVGIVVGVAAGGAGRVCRRARVRYDRRSARRAIGAVRRRNRRAGVRAGLARVRRGGSGTSDEDPDLGDGEPAADRAVAITVLLSVVAHGATAEPLAAWYAKLLAHRAASGPGALTPEMPDRRLIRCGVGR